MYISTIPSIDLKEPQRNSQHLLGGNNHKIHILFKTINANKIHTKYTVHFSSQLNNFKVYIHVCVRNFF